MTPEIRIRSWLRASPHDERRGLLGFISILYGELAIDGIAVRRSRTGRFYLSYPERRDRAGCRRPYVLPINTSAGNAIERRILGQLLDAAPGLAEGAEGKP